MIKIDEGYTDYYIGDDSAYPGGKAVDTSAGDTEDGTPYKADWMNDVGGFFQAAIVDALGKFTVSGAPDKVGRSDVLNALKIIIHRLIADDTVKKSVSLFFTAGDAQASTPLSRINGILTDGIFTFSDAKVSPIAIYWNNSGYYTRYNETFPAVIKQSVTVYPSPWTTITKLASIKEIGVLLGVASDGKLYWLKNNGGAEFILPDASFLTDDSPYDTMPDYCVLNGKYTFFVKSGADCYAVQFTQDAEGLTHAETPVPYDGGSFFVGETCAVFNSRLYRDVDDTLNPLDFTYGGFIGNCIVQNENFVYMLARRKNGRGGILRLDLSDFSYEWLNDWDTGFQDGVGFFTMTVFRDRPDDVVLFAYDSIGAVAWYHNTYTGELAQTDRLYSGGRGPGQRRLGKIGALTGGDQPVIFLYNANLRKLQAFLHSGLYPFVCAYIEEADGVVVLSNTASYDNGYYCKRARVLKPNEFLESVNLASGGAYIDLQRAGCVSAAGSLTAGQTYTLSAMSFPMTGFMKCEVLDNKAILTWKHQKSIICYLE
jgi:hypothetical protein